MNSILSKCQMTSKILQQFQTRVHLWCPGGINIRTAKFKCYSTRVVGGLFAINQDRSLSCMCMGSVTKVIVLADPEEGPPGPRTTRDKKFLISCVFVLCVCVCVCVCVCGGGCWQNHIGTLHWGWEISNNNRFLIINWPIYTERQ